MSLLNLVVNIKMRLKLPFSSFTLSCLPFKENVMQIMNLFCVAAVKIYKKADNLY